MLGEDVGVRSTEVHDLPDLCFERTEIGVDGEVGVCRDVRGDDVGDLPSVLFAPGVRDRDAAPVSGDAVAEVISRLVREVTRANVPADVGVGSETAVEHESNGVTHCKLRSEIGEVP